MAPSRALLLPIRSLFPYARFGVSSRRHFSSTPTTTTILATSVVVRRLLDQRRAAVNVKQQRQGFQQLRSLISTAQRNAPSEEETAHLTDGEKHVFEKLTVELQPARLEVKDVSGGCGSMYAIEVASKKFEGLSIMKQHRLVNSILADEIKSWHGLQLRTAPS